MIENWALKNNIVFAEIDTSAAERPAPKKRKAVIENGSDTSTKDDIISKDISDRSAKSNTDL